MNGTNGGHMLMVKGDEYRTSLTSNRAILIRKNDISH